MSDNDLSRKQKIDAFSRDLALFLVRFTGRIPVQNIKDLPKMIAPPGRGKSINSSK